MGNGALQYCFKVFRWCSKERKGNRGSDWKKYMHPKYQKRTFFPKLWTNDEIENWGKQNLESHEILSNFNQLEI